MSNARDWAADVNINIHALSAELVRQPSLVAYYSELLHQAEVAFRDEKLSFDAYESALIEMKQRELKPTGIKTTEAGMDRWIRGQQPWQVRKRALAMAELEVERIKRTLAALNHKRDMLIALAQAQRQEFRSLSNVA